MGLFGWKSKSQREYEALPPLPLVGEMRGRVYNGDADKRFPSYGWVGHVEVWTGKEWVGISEWMKRIGKSMSHSRFHTCVINGRDREDAERMVCALIRELKVLIPTLPEIDRSVSIVREDSCDDR